MRICKTISLCIATLLLLSSMAVMINKGAVEHNNLSDDDEIVLDPSTIGDETLGKPEPKPTQGLADTPWPMYHHDQRHSGLSQYNTSHVDGTILWKTDLGGQIRSSPVIGFNDTIYVTTFNGKLHCIHPNGTVNWTFDTSSSITSTPAIDTNGTIYFSADDDLLYAINPNGTEKWNLTVYGMYHSSPLIDDDNIIYIGTSMGLKAVNPDGTERWTFNTNGDVASSPALSPDNVIYFGDDSWKFYAIDRSGNELWTNDTGTIVSSPSVTSDSWHIYVGCNNGQFYSLSKNGFGEWFNFTSGDIYFTCPAVDSVGVVYTPGGDSLDAYKPDKYHTDGELIWRFQTGNTIYSSPAIGSDGTIYFGSNDNNIYALSPDGTKKWNITTGGSVRSSPAIGSDGCVYIGSNDNYLYKIGSDMVPPSVNSTIPEDNEKNVSVSQNVTAVFDESMNSTIIPNLVQTGGVSNGGWSFLGWNTTDVSNDTAIWSHNDWDSLDTVTLNITDYQDESGNVGSPYEWTFTTEDIEKPTVNNTTPSDNEREVSVSQNVVVEFSETMNTSVTPDLTQTDGIDPGGWTFLGWSTTNVNNDTVSWSHNDWNTNEICTLVVSNFQDSNEITGDPYEWTFSTPDSIPPEIYDNTVGAGYAGQQFTFEATVKDNIELDSVYLTYWTDVTSYSNQSMSNVGGDDYERTITISDGASELYYNISASDSIGNWNETGQLSITIEEDSEKPSIIDLSPSTATTGEQFTIKANVTDNEELDSVFVYYWTDVTDPENVTMDFMEGDNYSKTIDIPMDATELHYNISANDMVGNRKETGVIDLSITDNDPPSIDDNSDSSGTTGGSFAFNVSVSDNIGVSDVYVEYWFGETYSDSQNITLTNVAGEFWTDQILLPSNSTDTLHYNVSAKDTSGNWKPQSTEEVQITDNDSPTAVAGPDVTIEEGETVYFNGSESYDNIGISSYRWSCSEFDLSGAIANHTFDTSGTYNVTLTVEDAEGNQGTDTLVVTVEASTDDMDDEEDTDGDGIPDETDTDDDGDGLPDDYEEEHGLDPTDPSDADADDDGDGLTNKEEYEAGTDPNDPDTDGDGILDGDDADPLDPQKDNKDSSFPWWILAVIGAVVIAVVLALFFIKKKKEEPIEEELDDEFGEDEVDLSEDDEL